MTRRIAKGLVLQFNIGFVASTLYDALPELVRRFRITVPGVEVQLLEMTTIEQVAALKDGRIDVGFGRLRFDDEMITRKVIREEKLCVATPAGHRLTQHEGPLRLRHTANEPLIIYPSRRGQLCGPGHRLLSRRGRGAGHRHRSARAADGAGFVASGGGICIVPASVRRLGRDDVCYLELDEPQMMTPIIMSYRKNDSSRLLQQLVTLVRKFDKWDPTLVAASPPTESKT